MSKMHNLVAICRQHLKIVFVPIPNHRHQKNPMNSRFLKYPVLKDHHPLDSRNQLLKGRRDPHLQGLKAPLPQVIKEENLQLRNKKWVLVKVEIYVICAESNKTCKIPLLIKSIAHWIKPKFNAINFVTACFTYVQSLTIINTYSRRHDFFYISFLLPLLAYF